MDEDGFIKAAGFTAGNIHDSQCFTELLSGTEAQVYADSVYASGNTNEWLAQRGIENRVLERAYRNKPLTEKQKSHNQKCSPIRSIVERTFGILKLHCGMAQARYFFLARNAMRFGLMYMTHNIKRGVSLQREISDVQGSYVYNFKNGRKNSLFWLFEKYFPSKMSILFFKSQRKFVVRINALCAKVS